MHVEDVLCSKCRMRILKVLLQNGQLDVTALANQVRSSYANTIVHLKALEDEGIVLHRVYGRVKLFRVNEGSSKFSLLKNLIDACESTQT